MIAWNVDRIYEKLGGPTGVLAHCALFNNGTAPNYGTVVVWKHRQRIAAEWLPVILYGLFVLHGVQAGATLFTAPLESMEDVGL